MNGNIAERIDALCNPYTGQTPSVSVLLKIFPRPGASPAPAPTSPTCQKNSGAQMKAASTIKLPILLACMKEHDTGRLRFDEPVCVEAFDRVPYSLVTFLDATRWLLGDLVKLMIATSDNTATNLVAKRLGFQTIQNAIHEMGLSQTAFRRLMMDFEAAARGEENVTSLDDQCRIYEILTSGTWLSPEASNIALDILKEVKDSPLLRFFSEDECPLAHKTGGLPDVHHDAGVFYADCGAYFLGVFTKDIPEPEAKELIGKISRTAYDSRKEWYR